MKKANILASSTLAGALLFAGVGVHQANAAESEVTANNAVAIGSSVLAEHGDSPEKLNFNKPQDKGDYYLILFGNKSGHGSGAIEVYKDGLVKVGSGAAAGTENGEMTNVGYYQFDTTQENTSNNVANDNSNNEQKNQATNDNAPSQNNQTQNSTVGEENSNTQQQNQATTKALPESGEQSNANLVTIIASVLLAAGSLLTFKRFNTNK
ncbi:LPXTG cell wall anchor domain-containing protein [Staphylococcus sp. GDX8P80P]|uniref:LPXTG cell wall anchor domain-containing protein n=1 Tax=Staphylococcus sp. GDX8P80P TaxID=2804104 RepID=UPI001AEBAAFA|nr:LPXTG cell wall anchor domain-containing protein [Staphylococcus sp. GDX8P80P]